MEKKKKFPLELKIEIELFQKKIGKKRGWGGRREVPELCELQFKKKVFVFLFTAFLFFVVDAKFLSQKFVFSGFESFPLMMVSPRPKIIVTFSFSDKNVGGGLLDLSHAILKRNVVAQLLKYCRCRRRPGRRGCPCCRRSRCQCWRRGRGWLPSNLLQVARPASFVFFPFISCSLPTLL